MTTSASSIDRARLAMRIVAFGLGIFFIAMSLNKIEWLSHPEVLSQRFTRWLPNASAYAAPYLRHVAIPGAPIFARLVPIGEFLTGLSLLTGVLTQFAAPAALLMILNFHLATSAFSAPDFLRDGTGPPMIAALLALAVAGPLPLSLLDLVKGRRGKTRTFAGANVLGTSAVTSRSGR